MQEGGTFPAFRVVDFCCSFLVGTGRAAFLQTIAPPGQPQPWPPAVPLAMQAQPRLCLQVPGLRSLQGLSSHSCTSSELNS